MQDGLYVALSAQMALDKRLTTRYVPHVTFVLDEGVKKSIEIARIIREENERSAAANPSAETEIVANGGADAANEHPGAAAPPADPNAPAEGSTDRSN